MYPAVEVRIGGIGGDPTFDTGSTHMALLRVTNPTAWDWVYEITISSPAFAAWRLAGIGAFMSPPVLFPSATVPAGSYQEQDVEVAMISTPSIGQPVTISIREVTTGIDLGTIAAEAITLVELAVPAVDATLTWP